MNGLAVALGGVALLNLYALLLVVLRAPVYRTTLYRPMVLNICLSIAPALVLLLVLGLLLTIGSFGLADAFWPVLIVGGLIWLLLLPNSAYLITELNLSHRRDDEQVVPLWYDIVQTLTLALSGVMNGLANVAIAQLAYVLIAHQNAAHPFRLADSWWLSAGVLVLVALGMYLGRYLRLNSWDVTHPRSFVRKVTTHFGENGNLLACVGFTATHAVLLGLLYAIIFAPVMLTL